MVIPRLTSSVTLTREDYGRLQRYAPAMPDDRAATSTGLSIRDRLVHVPRRSMIRIRSNPPLDSSIRANPPAQCLPTITD